MVEQIPTPADVYDRIAGKNSKAAIALRKRFIDACNAEQNAIPFTVAAGDEGEGAFATVRAEFFARGWEIERKSDQRDGDYYTFSRAARGCAGFTLSVDR